MCVVTGVPQPTIRWFMGGDDNDRRINITDSSKYSVMGEILVIINITNDDANEYGCVATNIVDGMLQTDETSENFPLCGMASCCLFCVPIYCIISIQNSLIT